MSTSACLVYLDDARPFEQIAEVLRAQTGPSAVVELRGGSIFVAFGDWVVRIVDFREPWVPEEARELAESCSDPAKRQVLTASARRLEIELPDDPDDVHYHDGLLTFERLAAMRGPSGSTPCPVRSTDTSLGHGSDQRGGLREIASRAKRAASWGRMGGARSVRGRAPRAASCTAMAR